jgi:enoyl-CoA hydratase
MKQWSRQGLEGTLDAGLTMEEEQVVDGLMGPDPEEGLAAFQARREPNFS